MPFINIDNGEPTINPEHKLRISLSERAALTMANDMDVFGIDKKTTFLNQVFSNYRDDAKASISLYLEHRKEELSQMLHGTELNSKDKISVIDHLLQAEGLTKENVICCGDGFNDISMIKYAGVGVAMANAQPVVKEAADFITGSCDEDGLVTVIQKYIL